MGKVRTRGSASRLVEVDLMEMKFNFECVATTSADVSKALLKKSEKFLDVMSKAGYHIESMQIRHNSIEMDEDDDGVPYYVGERSIKWRLPFDVKVQHHILELIRKNNLEVSSHAYYIISNYEEIKADLLEKAVQDSMKRAQMIAAAAGQKVKGIHSTELNNYSDSIDFMTLDDSKYSPECNEYLANRLSKYEENVEESITITWNISKE